MTRKSSFRQGRSLNTVGLGWDSLHSLGPHSWALRSNYPRSRKQAVRTQTPSRGLGGVRHPRPGRASFLNPSERLSECLCHCAGSSVGGLQCHQERSLLMSHGGLVGCGSLAGADPCLAGRCTRTQGREDNPTTEAGCGSLLQKQLLAEWHLSPHFCWSWKSLIFRPNHSPQACPLGIRRHRRVRALVCDQ